MITLGVHDGHTATACLLEDGKVIACISEERLNRIKEWTGFPKEAVSKCLEITGKSPDEIDGVGVCSLMPQIGTESFYKPLWHKRAFGYLAKILPGRVLQSSQNIKIIQRLSETLFQGRREQIIEDLSQVGIKNKPVDFFEHHLLHAATAYYTNWYPRKENLIITLDGSGDAVCATVNIAREGEIRRIAEVFNYNSICDFYTRVTHYLGMKPMSHEYKVMGMAPYASEKEKTKILENFRKYFRVSEDDPMLFINTSGLWKWQFMREFQKKLTEKRFDWIAGAVQDLFEEVILNWVKNSVQATGIGNLALSGGGFMNVKLNYLISELPEVDSLFVFPSCGDESNPIGASILSALKLGFSWDDIEPLKMLYWGPSYTNEEVKRAIDNKLSNAGFNIQLEENINVAIAKKMAEKKIVGRFTGRMEWGARALGNRSILADARNPDVIHQLNKAIKMRDFWMPFAPAVLREYRDTYLMLRKDYRNPFMTIAPDTKPKAKEDIAAGLHPFDKSARAQVLDPDNHPDFYETVSQFEKITGVGGVLNTSYNLHGDPIVCSPEDAIDTFLNSGLDVLALEDYLIEK